MSWSCISTHLSLTRNPPPTLSLLFSLRSQAASALILAANFRLKNDRSRHATEDDWSRIAGTPNLDSATRWTMRTEKTKTQRGDRFCYPGSRRSRVTPVDARFVHTVAGLNAGGLRHTSRLFERSRVATSDNLKLLKLNYARLHPIACVQCGSFLPPTLKGIIKRTILF
ncbi:hypothetical protein DFH08DRAFT_883170 [Mycena albidolilacea]|uniref:Uncharacterized protein n=1 Tax=Mycena albidolilacea TaxID=1033008 RepID=A0AAD6ZMB7_9AGAR|nr:hypothetical protein DFH08DRAFT_883170 [Mycena albidolilacea]